MNIDKLTSKEFKEKLDKQIIDEKLSEIPVGLIHLLNNSVINYCLNQKVGAKKRPTARVLNNWIKELGIVKVDANDKGKIKRFDILESIWINILVELRDFGMSIDSIKRTRKILFDYKVRNFTVFKYHVINSIINESQTLVIFKDGGARILSTENYIYLLNKGVFLAHLSFKLVDFIKPEYPNHSFFEKFNITSSFEDIQKMKLLFFLRTGKYQYIKIKLSEQDIRYIENSKMFLNNVDAINAVSEWNFVEILISIDDDTQTIITPKI